MKIDLTDSASEILPACEDFPDDSSFVDIPSLENEPANVLDIQEGPLVFEGTNLVEPKAADPLGSSLHTTMSQESIDLDVLFPKEASLCHDPSPELSLRVSDVDPSALIEAVQAEPETPVTQTENAKVEEIVSEPDSKSDEKEDLDRQETRPKKSFAWRQWFFGTLILFVVTSLGLAYCRFACCNNSVDTTQPSVVLETIELVAELHIPSGTPTFGTLDSIETNHTSYSDTDPQKEETGPAGRSYYWLLFLVLGKFMFGGHSSPVKEVSNACEESCIPEDVPSTDHCAVDEMQHDFDLSNYEKLTVKDLRVILRSKKCSAEGRKFKLVSRLAQVYQAELQSLTVVQLRQKLKSKKMKQGGSKAELVKKLVEVGLV